MKKKIKMVFFDVGDTLIHPIPSFEDRMIIEGRHFGLNLHKGMLTKAIIDEMRDVSRAQGKGGTFTESEKASEKFWLSFYRRLLRKMVSENTEESTVEAMSQKLFEVFRDPQSYTLFEDVKETLELLLKADVRMGIISNFESWLHDVLGNMGIVDYFEVIVVSAEVCVEKPKAEIFNIAVAQSKLMPWQTMHVGDSPYSDVSGAKNAGIFPVLIDRYGKFSNIDAGASTVTDLRDIVKVMELRNSQLEQRGNISF